MKARSFFWSAIFLLATLVGRAQVVEMVNQGFENGETPQYVLTPGTASAYSTVIYKSGERSLQLLQQTDAEVELLLDTLDFTQNTSLRYIALQFDHICHVPVNGNQLDIGMIYYKRANQTDAQWTPLGNQEYNRTGETFSQQFVSVGAFNCRSYDEWKDTGAVPTNSLWRSERFDLDNVMTSSLAVSERKLLIKFVLKRRTIAGNADPGHIGWWLDNIRVSTSADRMVTPTISMVAYPHGGAYPNSRGARIVLDASTPVTAGINPDSVYLYYRAGSDPERHRVAMTAVGGVANRFAGRIPFEGYDTLMSFYCVVRDASGNANQMTFPKEEGTWQEFWYVRGTEQPGLATTQFTGTSRNGWFPFPASANHRSEWVYDSALLSAAGYGPGAITSLRFMRGANTTAQTRMRFQIKMKNVPSSYTVDASGSSHNFTTSYMHIVYDSVLDIAAAASGAEQTIQFQDTFYYSGQDIVMQMTTHDVVDPDSTSIRMIAAPATKKTLWYYGGSAALGGDPFNSTLFDKTSYMESKRPAFVMYQHKNMPLLYDAGVSELVDPNDMVPMISRPGSLTVKLKNFGAQPFQAVRISYNIDDSIFGHYDWTGNLAAGAEQEVVISTSIMLPAGFHTLTSWVEDSLTASGLHIRDHEPHNDTSFSEFIVCEGTMSGIRNIGGPNPHFNTIEEFLFSLSRCGVGDSLVVRLADGDYPAFVMPAVNGLSAHNYIVFEPQDGAHATLYSDNTLSQASIVDLTAVHHMRFRNLDFVRRSGYLANMVVLASTSADCRFEGCRFLDSLALPQASAMRIGRLLNSGYADSLLVDSCTFLCGQVGVDVRGQSATQCANGVTVRRSLFRNQYDYALRVENQTNITVEDNRFFDVLNNGGFVVQMNECRGTVSLQRNKVFTSHGAGGVGINNLIGTATNHALVANNMVASEDDGSSNQLRTPFNIIQATYTDVVYNSVKLYAPMRTNTPAATFGGGTLANSTFVNNIVAALDQTNYAFSYQPGSSTTNTVSHNDYYSSSSVLNRKGTSAYGSLAAWREVMEADSLSISVNPNFLDGGLADLRTYNRQLKGKGTPLALVTEDMFGNERSLTTPCPGAFEFASLTFDFEPEAMISPEPDNCNMPEQVELVLRLRNSGIEDYVYGSGNPLNINYRINNGAVQSQVVQATVPADDTVTVHTGVMLQLPPNGLNDATYAIEVWTSSISDPNQTNDTSLFSVVSRYHPAAPADDTIEVSYGGQAVITPTEGVDLWSVYNSSSAPKRPSSLYWYNSPDEEPFFVGPSYTTEELREGRTYYLRQRRAMPIVRITQVEILQANTAAGLTSPMPYWMLSSRKAAVQLTNIGDATAYLQGDTLLTVSPTTTGLNAKYYVFGNVKIEPGQSLVVQYVASGSATDSSLTITNASLGSTGVGYNSHIAFIYRHGGVVEDAVPFNNVISASTTYAVRWATQNVPSYVWSGAAITFPNNVAGVYRTAFNGNASDWSLSSAAAPMFLGSTDTSWIRYVDVDCEGDVATMTVQILAPPAADLDLANLVLPESGCGLTDEQVSVEVHNFGVAPISSFELNYCAGGDTVTETVTSGIGAHDTITYTFAQTLNLAFSRDSTVTVRVWATALADDPTHANDSVVGSVTSRLTPAAPSIAAMRQVPYGERDTITFTPTEDGFLPIWYDYDLNPVDTGFTHVTDILYSDGTMGISLMIHKGQEAIVGTGSSVNGKTAYPSPFQPNNAYAKQQYIYSAHDLSAAGLTAGNIYSIAFFLDSIYDATNVVRDSIVFDNYYIGMGLVSDTIFSNTSAWKSTSVVYHRQSQTIYRRWDKSWVSLDLDTPFMWDGTSSLVIQVSHTNAAAITSGVQTRYTAKTNTCLYKAQNTSLSPSVLEFTGAGSRNGNRPNLKFNEISGCAGSIATYNVHLIGIPNVDMAILPFPDTLVYNSCDSIELPVQVRNQGLNDLAEVKFYYYLDTLPLDSTTVGLPLVAGQEGACGLFKRHIAPGRHHVKALVHVAGDSIYTNDTAEVSFVVRFCGGSYTIAHSDTADYRSFSEAADSLNAVGIDGPVSFYVADGEYHEQVVLSNVFGSSEENSIIFLGQGDNVHLVDTASELNNYVFMVDGISRFFMNGIHITSVPAKGTTTSNKNRYYGHALVLSNVGLATITECDLKVSRAVAASDAEANHIYSCLALLGNVSNLVVSNCTLDSGFYAIKSYSSVRNYSNITIIDNTLRNFAYGGINIRGVEGLVVARNTLRSSNSSDSRGLVGIYAAQAGNGFSVERNGIYLINNDKGAKRGVMVEQVTGTLLNPARVVNNMISTYSTDSKGLPNVKVGNDSKTASVGIVVDSSTAYLNVFFNSVRVYGTTAANQPVLSLAFLCGTTATNVQVMNNIFSNFSKGSAYYVANQSSVTSSNSNAYYTESAHPFAWGTTVDSLHLLQNLNDDDAGSVFDEPYFVDIEDLHLLKANFVGLASYLTDVVDDFDGKMRSELPPPCIGAHELERLDHDMTVLRIYAPTVPATPQNIETDSVLVVAAFYNNGRSVESGVTWHAYIEGHETETMTVIRTLPDLDPSENYRDSVMMPTPLGLIYDQVVRVVVSCENDTMLSNNELTTDLYLAPAFNLTAVKVDATYPTTPQGCDMREVPVKITLKNVGNKDIPAGVSIKVGYHAEVKTPATLSFATMPDTVEQWVTLEDPLYTGFSVEVPFDSLANLYPTDTSLNITARLKGWCYYEYDIVRGNDTSAFLDRNSYYTPKAPVGHDTTFPYGTWGEVMAEQENSRPIRWYRDSTAAKFYPTGSSTNYNNSRRWSNTPQYFHDSTYYLDCVSDKNCPSTFDSVTVHVAPRIPNDMAFEAVLAPLGGRVYMQNDTVRVRVANYGTLPQSNIPITYQLKQGNSVLQTVTETITTTIPAGQTYIYTFDSLLNITTPTTAKTYTLNLWTDLSDDGTRRNDTIRTLYTFSSLAVSRYNTYQPPLPSEENTLYDITRVSWNGIDLDLPTLNRSYTNLADFSNPEYPVVHVTRGTTDSLLVEVTPLEFDDQSFRVRLWVDIDFNRDGLMNTGTCGERVVDGEGFWVDSVFRTVVTIPSCASYGYQRMRLHVGPYQGDDKVGHVIDFLLFVDEEPPTRDLDLAQMVSPRDYLIRDENPHVVSLRMLNRGATPITSVDLNYSFVGDTVDPTASGVVHWTGNLQPGASAVVSLPEHVFCMGTTYLTVWHNLEGDVDSTNNSFSYQYHRFHTLTLTFEDDFEGTDYWYAPVGYNVFNHNYWEQGTPSKTRLNAAYSGQSAWVTDLHNVISTGSRGNVSYLYSPIFNLSQIHADTIYIRVRRNLTNGSSLHLEYYNYARKWAKFDNDSCLTFYNDMDEKVFNGTTPNNSTYELYYISGRHISGDFNENLQLRFVYSTPPDNKANYGEGCALDDFKFVRARQHYDVGVVSIVEPSSVRYGQTYYPRVVVRNYGTDTIRQFQIGYEHYGLNLSRITHVNTVIAPDEYDTISFDTPMTITSDFPDTLVLTAYTILSSDRFRDQDTCRRTYRVLPLDNDIAAESFVAPLDYVIAGDTTVRVTMRLHNFGINPISIATATYIVNDGTPVVETIDFNALLDRPLESDEYFNFTFRQRIRAVMGVMRLTAYVKCTPNEYIYNDTITKRIEGIVSVTDLAASAIVVDTSSLNQVRIGLIIDNRGARGANNFEVGYWIDNDSSTLVSETYVRANPIPALSTGYYLFDAALPTRAAPYDHVNAYVRIDNDNDPNNDTTSHIVEQFVDIEVLKVLVEENANNDCRVFLQLRNVGNLALVDKMLRLRAVVNGNELSYDVRQRVDPGQVMHLEFDRTIPKSPTRTYVGSGSVDDIPGDDNLVNNQTSVVEVVNYVEGIPAVNAGRLVLEQNYPNPFSQRTTVAFSLPAAAQVRFFVMDAMGHIVHSTSQFYQSGSHTLHLDLEAFPAGVYYYGIEVDGQRQMRKMIRH